MSIAITGWFVDHYRAAQAQRGTQSVARQLRKQGVPIGVAIAILAQRGAA